MSPSINPDNTAPAAPAPTGANYTWTWDSATDLPGGPHTNIMMRFIVTDGGKTISPTFIESIVRTSPYVAEVVVFGHGRKYLTALIEIEYDAVCQWARSNNVDYSGYTNLAQHAEVAKLLQRDIASANEQLARAEQIKMFRVLPKMLDPEEEGEPVTPTRKVKRELMYQRFRALIESMYDDSETRMVAHDAGGIASQAA